jgi:hypothetical protein
VLQAKERLVALAGEAAQEAALEALLDKVAGRWRGLELQFNLYRCAVRRWCGGACRRGEGQGGGGLR